MSSPSDGDTADRTNTASLPPFWQELASAGPSAIMAGLPEPCSELVKVEITGPDGQRHVMKVCAGVYAAGGTHT
jgi:hypothetical protein